MTSKCCVRDFGKGEAKGGGHKEYLISFPISSVCLMCSTLDSSLLTPKANTFQMLAYSSQGVPLHTSIPDLHSVTVSMRCREGAHQGHH